MKQIKIRSLKYPDPAINWDFQAESEEPKLSEMLSSGICGKPERWILHKDEPMAEAYDDADVLEEELRELTPAIDAVIDEQGVEVSPAIPAVMQKWVKLKSEYTVEIEDITAEHELAECIRKRKAEYPSAEEFLNAFFDGGEVALNALHAARLAIKAKYPKPQTSE